MCLLSQWGLGRNFHFIKAMNINSERVKNCLHIYIRGVLRNKCAGQHNLKTLQFQETIVLGNF